jgi:hypothetical protein
MKKTSFMIMLFVSVGFGFTSCKKDPTNKEMLVKKWKVDELLIDSTNFTAFVANTRFDFLDNNTLIITDPNETPDTLVWVFNEGETQILIGSGEDQEVWGILELTPEILKADIEDPDVDTKVTLSPVTE